MTCNMEEVLKLGLMDLNMMVIMLLVENMELELIGGMMVHNTQETGKKTKYQVQVYTPGQMAESMKENGKIIIWKEQVSIYGMMEENTKDNTEMTKNMDLEFIRGRMVVVMKDIGTKANNMVQEPMQCPKKIK